MKAESFKKDPSLDLGEGPEGALFVVSKEGCRGGKRNGLKQGRDSLKGA